MPTKKVNPGDRFGKLQVISAAHSRCEPCGSVRGRSFCKCECGGSVTVDNSALMKGDTQSCGCIKTGRKLGGGIDLVGKRFGKLTVTDRGGFARRTSGASVAVWVCVCDCGSTVNRKQHNLTERSCCGCNRGGWRMRLSPGDGARNHALAMYKAGAKVRGLNWEISTEQFRQLITANCHYCGAAPLREVKTGKCNGSILMNGIDRLDNALGYVTCNVVTSCSVCNRAKYTMNKEQFCDWIHRVATHLKLG